MDALLQFGISLTQSLQRLSPALDGVMNFFTFLGRIEFYLLIIPFIYWAVDKRVGIRTLLILIFIDVVGVSFKLLFHQPRPYWVGSVKELSPESSYGIPSTHASDSLAVGGFLAFQAKKRWLWIVMVITIFFIGLSRIYLAAHFPHDVLFGWLIGALVLWASIKWGEPVFISIKSKALTTQISTAFFASLIVILIGIALHSLIAGVTDPVSWSKLAVDARSISHFFTLSGALFGSITGYALMRSNARFKTPDEWGKRALIYVLGMAGLLIIYVGLDKAFGLIATDETGLGYFLRYTRYALVTFWMTFLAPWIFLKTNLVKLE